MGSSSEKPMELDGYAELEVSGCSIAFEYQGPQHTDPKHWTWRNRQDGDTFERQQQRDARKAEVCFEKGVMLIEVPHTADCIGDFIAEKLVELGLLKEPRSVPKEVLTAPRIQQRGSINITDCMTAAGLAKKYFYNCHYDEYPIFTLTSEQDSYIRDNSYYGGRVEIFQMGVINGPVYYLDVTSLYPAMGAKYDMPYGEPKFVDSFPDGNLPADFFGFVRCLVRSTTEGLKHKPIHATKGNKLVFQHVGKDGRWTEMTLFSEELRLGKYFGFYEYQLLDGYTFRRGPVLKSVFTKLFDLKSQAKKEGKSSKEKAIKIVANSTYGFFGFNPHKETIKLFQSGDVPIYDYLSRGALLEEADHGAYTSLRVEEKVELKDYNVAIAAAVTSWARMFLWRLMDDIDRLGGSVYSCDTDSITTNLDFSKHPDLMKKYIFDYKSDNPGGALGSLKCECADEVEKRLKKLGLKGEALKDALIKERGSQEWKPIPFYHPEG